MSMNQLDISGANSTNLTFDHITYDSPHGCVSVEGQSTASRILFDHNRLDNIETEGVSGCLNEGRLGIQGRGPNGWVTVTNSHFGGNTLPGCSDGIQVGGHGVVIGPRNEFTGIYQGNCDAHSDPIQFYCCPPGGASNNVVTGNWFHDNTTGCMCWDGGDNNTFTNNVFESIGYWSIVAGSGENNWLIAHNVFGDDVTMDNGHSAPNGTGNVVRDNVWLPGKDISDKGSGVSYDHNLNSGKSGTGNLKGRPVFVGGRKPTSYQGYRLARGSPGKGSASDGGDLGIRGSVVACKRGSVAALVGGKRVCLKAGNRCKKRYDRQYRNHGFRCVKGRLRKLPKHRSALRVDWSVAEGALTGAAAVVTRAVIREHGS